MDEQTAQDPKLTEPNFEANYRLFALIILQQFGDSCARPPPASYSESNESRMSRKNRHYIGD
jgi:hypothetical protein